ncbi:phage baseplate assembly protein V [Sulfurivirga sp.]|uniref:phage baseplate assembly protein V n=1 Tax=Sulfurivirga sp. TaxID=2614236 RepID=UPI0025CE5456|nr:phage baseplate assembly protein V [Sulfurivirga sp.]
MSEMEWMIGRIEQQDFTGPVHRYRVRLADGQLSAWLPKLNPFADGSTTDKPLAVGTQVVVLLARDREEGVILGALNCHAHPDPASRDTLHRTRYADGTVVEYDMDSHTLTIDCVGDVVITSKTHITLKAPRIDLN